MGAQAVALPVGALHVSNRAVNCMSGATLRLSHFPGCRRLAISRSAVVVLDMQNAFLAEGGSLARRGDQIPDAGTVISAVNALVALAHDMEMPVIFTRVIFDAESDSPLRRRLQSQDGRDRDYLRGSFGTQLVPLEERRASDMVLDKTSYDAFQGTGLESTLRTLGIDRLLVAGVLTNICVESCARSAFERGFEVIVVEDATASYSAEAAAASLAVIRRSFGSVVRLGDLAQRLGSSVPS
jgi:ureidoacrylate peracid hydrolase